MAHITTNDVSNFSESLETAALTKQGLPSHWPPVTTSKKEQRGATRAWAETPLEYPEEKPVVMPVESWGEGPVSVADQKAAGVHPDNTVTIADQKAGVPLPEVPGGSDQSSVGTSSSTSESKPGKSGSSAPETGSSLPSPAPGAENLSGQDPASSPAQSSSASSTSGSTQETGPSQPAPSNSSEGQATPQPSATEAIRPLNGRELIHEARKAYEAKDWAAARQLLLDAEATDASVSDEVNLALQAVQTASEQDPSGGGFLVQ